MSSHPRVPVGPSRLDAAVKITPIATPVDRFVKTDAGNTLSQVANALGKLDPTISKLGTTIANVEIEVDVKAGEKEALFLEQTGMTLAEAKRKGLVEGHTSKFFRASRDRRMGQTAGMQQALRHAEFMASPEMQALTDVEDMNRINKIWMEEDLAENVPEGEFSDEFITSMARTSTAQIQNQLAGHVATIALNFDLEVEEGQRAQAATGVRTILDSEDTPGFSKVQRITEYGTQLLQEWREAGTPGREAHLLLIQAVASLAVPDGRPDLMVAVGEVLTGEKQNIPLKNIPEFAKLIRKEKLSAISAQADGVVRENRIRKEAGEAIRLKAQEQFMIAQENGTLDKFDLSELFTMARDIRDPDLMRTIILDFNGYKASVAESDLMTEDELNRLVSDGLTLLDLQRIRNSGNINNKQRRETARLINNRDVAAGMVWLITEYEKFAKRAYADFEADSGLPNTNRTRSKKSLRTTLLGRAIQRKVEQWIADHTGPNGDLPGRAAIMTAFPGIQAEAAADLVLSVGKSGGSKRPELKGSGP